jgi:hypothetical protein
LNAYLPKYRLKLKIGQESREAVVEVGIERTDAFRTKNVANEGEETEAVVDNLEVPNEEANMDTIEALENLLGNRHLGRHKQKTRTLGECWSRQKLAAARDG